LFILFTSVFIFYQYTLQKDFLYQCVDDKLKNAAYSGAFLLGDMLNDKEFDLSAISEDENKKNALLLSKLTDENDVSFVYTLVKKDEKVYFSCSSVTKEEKKKEDYIPYLFEYKGATQKLKDSFSNHQTYFGEVTDEYGTFRSIIMLRETQKGYWYIVGADIEISFIDKELHKMLVEYIFIFLFFIAGLVLFIRKWNTILDDENQEKLFAQKRLLEHSKLAQMGEMIGNITHQWRQPLGEIDAVLMRLESEYNHGKLDKQRLEKTITQIENITDYMSITIDNFTTHLKDNQEKKRFQLSKMVQKSLDLMEANSNKHHISVDLKVKDDKTLEGVEGRFIQVIIAIIQNATDILVLKRDSSDRKIDITLFTQKEEFVISIKNNGEKIPDDVIEYIFEPYFTTKFKAQGTGIGLYLSKIIIEKTFDGKLEVENIADGVEFKIIL
jgi:signal transduction histidine kinase